MTQQRENHEESSRTEKYGWDNLPKFRPSKASKTKWIWPDFIPERAITIVWGAEGTFKSTFTLALLTQASRGKPFMGLSTRKRRVLCLDNENPPDVLRRRDRAMGLEMETNRGLRLWSLYDDAPVPKIPSHRLRQIVRESYAETGKPLLIVLDHWSTFLKPGDSGLKAGETTPILQELRRLCALGATIVILGHTLKYDKKTFYGVGDMSAKPDAMHTFVLGERSGRPIVKVSSFLKRHGRKREFTFIPIIKELDNGKTRVTGFRFSKDHSKSEGSDRSVETMRGVIKRHPKMAQTDLAKRVAKKLDIGWNKMDDLLKKYDGKHWKSSTSSNGKKTYALLPAS